MSNQSYTVKRRLAQWPLFSKKARRLQHLDIELTERCNNACLHCYINLPADDEQASRRELTTEQWKDILHQAADLGAISARFTGGEPLLRPDFTELYLFARRLGLKIILFTNARLITPELADLFARVPPLKKLEISVYGMHRESYESITCNSGSFIEFRHGLDLLRERQIPYVVKSVLLPHNLDEIEEFETWAAKLPWMDRHPPYISLLDHRTRRDSPARNRLINSIRFSPEEFLMLLTKHEAAYRQEMAQFCSRFISPQGDRLFACGAGETGCVDAYGNYQMCMLLRHPETVYDLHQGTLRQALTEVFPRLRELRATNPEYLQRCARCFLKGLCEQCPAKSWSEHGTLDTPVEYLCQLAHTQAYFLGLLAEGEHGWDVADWQDRTAALAQKHFSESNITGEIHFPVCNEGDL